MRLIPLLTYHYDACSATNSVQGVLSDSLRQYDVATSTQPQQRAALRGAVRVEQAQRFPPNQPASQSHCWYLSQCHRQRHPTCEKGRMRVGKGGTPTQRTRIDRLEETCRRMPHHA